MAPSSSSSSSSPSSASTSKSPPFQSLFQTTFRFTTIQECDEDESMTEEKFANRGSSATPNHRHFPTPLNEKAMSAKRQDFPRKQPENDDVSVSCNKCRPHSHREKMSVVPLESNGPRQPPRSMASPNGVIKSIFQSLTGKSPKPADVSPSREEQWKIAVAELTHKLIQVTRKRDEALSEASKLKTSMAELEKKLNKLEIYCHNLKSGLDECSNNQKQNTHQIKTPDKAFPIPSGFSDRITQQFLVSVSESRSSLRILSKSLSAQLRHMDMKIYERLSILLQPYVVKLESLARNPKMLMIYLEALLNRAFFEDFESSGFQKNSETRILNPIDRCEANYASFNNLVGLTWQEVLNKGTRHFSEDFSKFCDRKMSDIVTMLGWNRAWPETLLQAFFGASKRVWLVHLLANSISPAIQIFRVDKGARFEPLYMEDASGVDRHGRVGCGSVVRVMVQPGFYVSGNVVKCKVLCKSDSGCNIDSDCG